MDVLVVLSSLVGYVYSVIVVFVALGGGLQETGETFFTASALLLALNAVLPDTRTGCRLLLSGAKLTQRINV